jgi:hypothetical protein
MYIISDSFLYAGFIIRWRDLSIVTERDREQLNIFERKVCRRIPAPVYDSAKENWRILTDKEIYAVLKTYHNRDDKAT